jgi:transposase
MERRIVGIDLGIASEHTVRVFDQSGTVLAKRKALPNRASLLGIEQTALWRAPQGTRLEVVLEPTGPAWLPIAVFFAGRGHLVYRVSSQKAADLRRFLSRHAKSNGIDADTLARLPLVAPESLQPLVLPSAEQAALDRRVRACDRLTYEASRHKVRIKDLVRQLMPMTPLQGELGRADLAVLERYADPRALMKAGKPELTRLIAAASKHHLGEERASKWLEAAAASLELYGTHPMPFGELAEEVASEVRLLKAIEAELKGHEQPREAAYKAVDPSGLARSVPGLKTVGGPALVACMVDPRRFRGAAAFRSFTGLTPKASETGETDRKGEPISKAGSRLLRTTLVRAADTARKQDPELAKIYFDQVVQRGKSHLGAICVVAAELAERAFVVMSRRTPYELRDLDGRPVTPEQAKAIIAAHFTVTEEVRARRRSKKAGKAPHGVVSQGPTTRRPSPRSTPHRQTSPVKKSA